MTAMPEICKGCSRVKQPGSNWNMLPSGTAIIPLLDAETGQTGVLVQSMCPVCQLNEPYKAYAKFANPATP